MSTDVTPIVRRWLDDSAAVIPDPVGIYAAVATSPVSGPPTPEPVLASRRPSKTEPTLVPTVARAASRIPADEPEHQVELEKSYVLPGQTQTATARICLGADCFSATQARWVVEAKKHRDFIEPRRGGRGSRPGTRSAT